MKNLIIIFALIFSINLDAQIEQKDFLKNSEERLVQIEKEQCMLMMSYLMPFSEQKVIADAYNVLENEKRQIFILQDVWGWANKVTFIRENQEHNHIIPYEPLYQTYNEPHLRENDRKKRKVLSYL